MSWFAMGQIVSLVGLAWLGHASFDMPVWETVVAVALSFWLALVACRVTGETDTTLAPSRKAAIAGVRGSNVLAHQTVSCPARDCVHRSRRIMACNCPDRSRKQGVRTRRPAPLPRRDARPRQGPGVPCRSRNAPPTSATGVKGHETKHTRFSCALGSLDGAALACAARTRRQVFPRGNRMIRAAVRRVERGTGVFGKKGSGPLST
jgi:hypothetical protein